MQLAGMKVHTLLYCEIKNKKFTPYQFGNIAKLVTSLESKPTFLVEYLFEKKAKNGIQMGKLSSI